MAGCTSGRNEVLKRELLEAPHWLCMERAKAYTDTYKETEGQHPSLRAAHALQRTFAMMSISINPAEMLVGNRSSKTIAPPIAPERGDFTMIFKHRMPDLQAFGYNISKEDRDVLFKEIIPYWQGKTVRDQKVARFAEHGLNSTINFSPRELARKQRAFGLAKILGMLVDGEGKPSRLGKARRVASLLFNLPRHLGALKSGTADNVIGRGRCIDTQAHIVVGHKNVLRHGFKGLALQATEQLSHARNEDERSFLEATIIACNAVREFSLRFSALATDLSKDEGDPRRKQELVSIARACEKVPWNPPETFLEALQAMWFTQNAIIISYGAGSGITPGRVDQLLYPFYTRGKDDGTLTDEDALGLIEEFIIKINNNVVIWPNIVGVKLNHLGSDIENITIGGLGRDGRDATNDLSNLFIDAVRNVRLATTASFRLSSKSPPDFVRKVIELHGSTSGPALFNDDIVVPTLVNDGYAIEDARDYCLVGCVEPCGNGDTFGATGGTKIYLPSVLDMVFNRGRTSFFGNVDGPDTGDPGAFTSFDAFMDAYYLQMQRLVSAVAKATNLRDEIWANQFHNPLISCTIDGCIENARDMTRGGARYNFGAIGAGGLGTVVDSLAAIKHFVYDEKSIAMADIIEAISVDFKGHETLRERLKRGPKFGNDDDAVDAIAADLVGRFCAMCRAEPTINGGHFKASFISYGLNVYEGVLEPATPDGRRAGEPLSNSISPSNGAEMNGPTATMNSIAKIDQTRIGFGNSLNMKFPRYLLGSGTGVKSLESLELAYFKKGGFHVQFNVIDADVLRDAQLHPEQHADLIVRVSGYSAYFTRLGREIQDDLIRRVEFSCMA